MCPNLTSWSSFWKFLDFCSTIHGRFKFFKIFRHNAEVILGAGRTCTFLFVASLSDVFYAPTLMNSGSRTIFILFLFKGLFLLAIATLIQIIVTVWYSYCDCFASELFISFNFYICTNIGCNLPKTCYCPGSTRISSSF